jgi:hypothetical protein
MYNDKQTRKSVDNETAERSCCTDCPAEDDECAPTKEIEGRKRARRCSHDTFQELERFLRLHGLDCNNITRRYCSHEPRDEEGTDMSFLVLPLCMEQKNDLLYAAANSLQNFLDTTEQ